MTNHGGQMPGGTLDVTELWVTEPVAADAPSEAIPKGGEFTLHTKFSGSGGQWGNMKREGHEFKVFFHLEGMGITEDEVDYGPVTVNLVDGQDEYEVEHPVTAAQNTLPVGLYRCGCTIENTNWIGAVGYIEGLILQIYGIP